MSHPKIEVVDFGSNNIYLFPFSLSVSVYVYASLGNFACIALLLPFVIHPRVLSVHLVFFFNDTATTEIYTLSLHDALPI